MAVSLLVILAVAGISRAQDTPQRLPRLFPFQPLNRSKEETTLHFSRDPVVNSSSGVTPAGGKKETPKYGRPQKEETESSVVSETAGHMRLFRRESENDFFERIRQDARQRLGTEKIPFPEETLLTKEKHQPRNFPPKLTFVEPAYVVHGRLPMAQTNFERAGYDFGLFQPAVSLGVFYFDLITLPYQYCKRPFQQLDTSAGKCLPGDPSPMLLYPPEPSLTGLVGESLFATGLFLGFP